jgi:hypothetical protein
MRISDEQLNHLADQFVQNRIGQLLKITFEQYLQDPEGYNQTAFYLLGGGALCTYYQPGRQVGKSFRQAGFKSLKTAV